MFVVGAWWAEVCCWWIFPGRYFRITSFGFHSFGLRHDDILYNCLPLYHSAGRLHRVPSSLSLKQLFLFTERMSLFIPWQNDLAAHTQCKSVFDYIIRASTHTTCFLVYHNDQIYSWRHCYCITVYSAVNIITVSTFTNHHCCLQ